MDAGPDQLISLPGSADVQASVTIDVEPVDLPVVWSQVSGPGAASIVSTQQTEANISFTMPGDYVFRASATHSSGTRSDELAITVLQAVDLSMNPPTSSKNVDFWFVMLENYESNDEGPAYLGSSLYATSDKDTLIKSPNRSNRPVV